MSVPSITIIGAPNGFIVMPSDTFICESSLDDCRVALSVKQLAEAVTDMIDAGALNEEAPPLDEE